MLTARGKVFADVIKDICWTKGWAIAGNYVDAATEEIEGYEIDYQFDHYPRRPNKKVGKD